MVIFDFFTKNAIFVVLTRIDLRAQKELESGRGLKKLEIIWIFQKKNNWVDFGHFSGSYGQKRACCAKSA